MVPRIYKEPADLQKMCALLQRGCTCPTGAYYPHPGDLHWWLYNWLDGHDPWQDIYLWDDTAESGRLLAWALLSTPWSAFDVFVQPELWDSAWVTELNTWVEGKSTEKALEQGHKHIWRMNVAETDPGLCDHLRRRGFQHVERDDMLALTCSLERNPPQPALPAGYTLRQVVEADAQSRAMAQYAAFKADIPWDDYLQRYRNFLTSPAYDRGHDWIVIAPDGRVAAFCIVWPDAATCIGQIEPIGTHPDFQHQGLGKAVMTAGLGYLQSLGMRSARVSVRTDNVKAIRLYESVGFRMVKKLLTYQKLI